MMKINQCSQSIYLVRVLLLCKNDETKTFWITDFKVNFSFSFSLSVSLLSNELRFHLSKPLTYSIFSTNKFYILCAINQCFRMLLYCVCVCVFYTLADKRWIDGKRDLQYNVWTWLYWHGGIIYGTRWTLFNADFTYFAKLMDFFL